MSIVDSLFKRLKRLFAMKKNRPKRNYLENLTVEEKALAKALNDHFDKDRQGISDTWKEWFSQEIELFDLVLSFFAYFLEKLRKKKEVSRFDEALLILASKMISDAQGARLSIENGWTGTAMGVSRMFWSAHNMIMFLAYYPEYLEEWFSEKHDTYQVDREFQKLFAEGNISKKLAEKGFELDKLSFQILSKGSHASYWGAQIYTDEGYVTFQPRPCFFKTIVILSEISAVISALINWYIEKKPESFESIFENADEQELFKKLHTKLNQSCGRLMHRATSFSIDHQDEREEKGGELLKRIDPSEWQKQLEEIARRGDPPLDS